MNDKIEGVSAPKNGANVISKEMALDEFERFADCMDLYLEPDEMDDEDRRDFFKIRGRLVRAICNGSLVIDNNGQAVYTPQNDDSKHKTAITFHERSGATVIAQDGKGKNAEGKKTYAMMGELTRLHERVFSGLVGIDIKICQDIYMLLMD